ncbi:hypothetical protein ACZ90_07040 [Streptomyces albus subsp. albus]|nr:hypothetical protein ACZ90_07040 [Streptomyces albus subsp. albus]
MVTPAEDWRGALGVAGLVLLVIAGAWGAGFTVRGRRAESAREQRRRSEHALDEERLRIARELHDIVSHNLSPAAHLCPVGQCSSRDSVFDHVSAGGERRSGLHHQDQAPGGAA